VNLAVIQTIPPGFIIHLTTRPPDQVTVPSVIGADSLTARGAIQVAGLVANFVGPLENSEVQSQSPEGGAVVPRGSMVTLHMARTDL
jgi:beta-lactam-binding protein with PASTA domain